MLGGDSKVQSTYKNDGKDGCRAEESVRVVSSMSVSLSDKSHARSDRAGVDGVQHDEVDTAV